MTLYVIYAGDVPAHQVDPKNFLRKGYVEEKYAKGNITRYKRWAKRVKARGDRFYGMADPDSLRIVEFAPKEELNA